MWILFALTSATILASRKIQEKKLVGDVGSALGWMIRLGSAITTGFAWLLFSRNLDGIFSWQLWAIIGFIALVAYPLQMFLYFRAMHELPLSLFGMLAGVVPFTSLLVSWLFLDLSISISGFIGICLVVTAIALLVYKHEHKDIALSSILIAIMSYMIMGAGTMLDKLGLSYVDPYSYAFLNQTLSAITLFLTAYYFSDTGVRYDFFQKNRALILAIGLSQGVSWVFGIFALSWAPNPGYTTALINTHTIITALYGIFFLKEKVTKRKLFVFLCMVGALVCFAFA